MAEFDRRGMLGASLASLALPSLAWARSANELVYVGMHGEQIHAARFDAASGALTPIGPVAPMPRPTWGLRHPSQPVVYFAEETGSDGKKDGGVRSFRVNRSSGALTPIGEVRAGGAGTTCLSFDATSRTILTANYAGGTVAAIAVERDGSLGAVTSVCKLAGSGPHRRQASSHPHQIVLDPTGRFALVPDLGADRVFVIPFDRHTRRLAPIDAMGTQHYAATPGSGPRHLAFAADGRHAFLIDELSAEIETLAWDARAGRLAALSRISLNADAAVPKSGGEIAASRDGRFVYSSNRGDHTLLVHTVAPRSGRLNLVQRLPAGGEKPWHFALHPNGRWLLVANRDANVLRLFGVDRKSGLLSDNGQTLASPTPVFALFFD